MLNKAVVHASQVLEAANGEAPMFQLRATSLGDNSTIIAASWLHILADGADRMAAHALLSCPMSHRHDMTALPGLNYRAVSHMMHAGLGHQIC